MDISISKALATQSGALVNSANVTDPVTGSPAINLPIDVVSSVQVISNPYDPQNGKFTGAVSTVATKTSDYEKFHFSFQNFVPRLRDRDGTIAGIGASTPRMTFTAPIVKDRIAITQSFEYRYVRTPVNSLPALQRDTKLESFDSCTQFDFILTAKQTATASVALYPQKLFQCFDFQQMSKYQEVLEPLLFYLLHRANDAIQDRDARSTFKTSSSTRPGSSSGTPASNATSLNPIHALFWCILAHFGTFSLLLLRRRSPAYFFQLRR
jgi:hypothetical protein